MKREDREQKEYHEDSFHQLSFLKKLIHLERVKTDTRALKRFFRKPKAKNRKLEKWRFINRKTKKRAWSKESNHHFTENKKLTPTRDTRRRLFLKFSPFDAILCTCCENLDQLLTWFFQLKANFFKFQPTF